MITYLGQKQIPRDLIIRAILELFQAAASFSGKDIDITEIYSDVIKLWIKITEVLQCKNI